MNYLTSFTHGDAYQLVDDPVAVATQIQQDIKEDGWVASGDPITVGITVSLSPQNSGKGSRLLSWIDLVLSGAMGSGAIQGLEQVIGLDASVVTADTREEEGIYVFIEPSVVADFNHSE